MLGRLWAAQGLTGVYSGNSLFDDRGATAFGVRPRVLASSYFRIRVLLSTYSTPDFGLAWYRNSGIHYFYILFLNSELKTISTHSVDVYTVYTQSSCVYTTCGIQHV